MPPNSIVITAAIIRLVYSAWVLYVFGRAIGKVPLPLTKRGYGFICFLVLINLIISGRALGWW